MENTKMIKIKEDDKMVEIPIRKTPSRKMLDEFMKERREQFMTRRVVPVVEQICEDIRESVLMPCFDTLIASDNGNRILISFVADEEVGEIMGTTDICLSPEKRSLVASIIHGHSFLKFNGETVDAKILGWDEACDFGEQTLVLGVDLYDRDICGAETIDSYLKGIEDYMTEKGI